AGDYRPRRQSRHSLLRSIASDAAVPAKDAEPSYALRQRPKTRPPSVKPRPNVPTPNAPTAAALRQVERRCQRPRASCSSSVIGLNSVRAWRHQSGGVRSGQLQRAAELLAGAPGGALRVVVLHHHLIGAPWRSRKKPVAGRSHVLAALVDAGAELILAGHIHQ